MSVPRVALSHDAEMLTPALAPQAQRASLDASRCFAQKLRGKELRTAASDCGTLVRMAPGAALT